MKNIFLLFSLSVLFIACGNNDDPDNGVDKEGKIDWNVAADESSMALVHSFWNINGRYFNYDSNGKSDFHYWPQAHALDVLTDAYLRTGNDTYKNYFDQWFEGVKVKNGNTFRNDYYDDMEWNALALLRVYQATRDTKYKEAVLELWDYIKTGWNDHAGGGISWVKGQNYMKNACSNGPACILAARLYQEFGDESDKEWAISIYNWEKNTLFNANGMVYDHFNAQTGEINRDWIFTYNQGTFIGSAIELFRIFGESFYVDDAVLAADYTINSLVVNFMLKDEGTGDGGLFKGIFVRYFTELILLDELEATVKEHYIQFLERNAKILWTEGTRKPSVFFGTNWRTMPGVSTGLTEQLSGNMLIEAMALLENEGLLFERTVY